MVRHLVHVLKDLVTDILTCPEIIDFGYPQNSEIDTLKTYITTESIVSSAIAAEESSKITTQATGNTSWRRADVKYKKNEAFVDVVETVNLSMSAKGELLSQFLSYSLPAHHHLLALRQHSPC